MRFALFLLWCLPFGVLAQQPSIYNDDPEQRLPVGVEKPPHGFISAAGGTVDRARVEPPHWYLGMPNPDLQVLIYDQNIGQETVTVRYPGVLVGSVERVENPNYLFVNLHIGPGAKPGKFDLRLGNGTTYPYELKRRSRDPEHVGELETSDLIYLILPDRFANGDPKNDSIPGMRQQGVNRNKMFFRHGGDLRGIIDHLDYVDDLGATVLWLNPVLENDQPYESYHGYAVTDHYRVDRRLGSNADYKELVDRAHDRQLKVVMDIIFNHVGNEHWFIRDLPERDWIHQWAEFTRPIYRGALIHDPHAAASDKKQLLEGWFDQHMPDLNQRNPRLARYLIQNTIWWAEWSGHDGYRIDTYFYPDPDFMAQWAYEIQRAFPNLILFGETWVQGPAIQASFTEDNRLIDDYNAHLPSVTDFQVHFAIEEALHREQSWTGGITRLYYTLAQDFLYEDANRNVLFLDNHDKSRFYSTVDEDDQKFKTGIALLLTLRGIPSLYYGTELKMTGYADPDGKVRQDMPGGFAGDSRSVFKTDERTDTERAAYEFVKNLAQYRKRTPALHSGQLTHYVPENDIYVYFRHNADATVMVVVNTKGEAQTVETTRYRERMDGFDGALDVLSGTTVGSLREITVPAHGVRVLELR